MLHLPKRHYFMIAVLAVAAYAPTLRMGFLWDDHAMIEANPFLRQWSFQNVKHDFTADVFDRRGDAYYRPLQTLANRMDYTLWGLRPAGYHLTNLLFHIGNGFLVAELTLALGSLPLTALLTASLFVAHPMIVEQLMIISGRAELMGFFFSLLAVLMLAQKRKSLAAGGCLAYLASLLCKESGVATPLLLALVFYYKREPLRAYARVAILIILTAPYLWLRNHIVGPPLSHADAWLAVRFFFQEFPHVLWRYLSLLIFPWNLHSHRLLPRLSHFWSLYLAVLIAAIAGVVKKFPRTGVFCVAWFVLILLPKTPVMIYGNFMLDHWVYPASFAVLWPLGILLSKGWNSCNRWAHEASGYLYFGLVIVWALLVHLNVALRGTDEKMYRWALRFTTSNPIKYNLGILLLETGRPGEAVAYLEDVREAYPEDLDNANALALAYWKMGHAWLAVRMLEDLARKNPGNARTRRNLAHLKRILNTKAFPSPLGGEGGGEGSP